MHILNIVAQLAPLFPAVLAVPKDIHRIVDGLAPVVRPATSANLVPHSYIVVQKPWGQFNAGAKFAHHVKRELGAKPNAIYDGSILQGFSADLDDKQLHSLRQMSDVDYIEHDTVGTIMGYKSPEQRVFATQEHSGWGLHRISASINYHPEPENYTSYKYEETAGEGSCVYVLDSGVLTTHPELEGRVEFLVDYTVDNPRYPSGSNHRVDRVYHGTNVATVVAGKTFGVAKKAKIFDITVINTMGEYNTSALILGLQRVVEDSSRRRYTDCKNGVIVNLSIGSPGVSQALNQVTSDVAKKGIFIVAAAGNEGVDVSTLHPANAPGVCTVAAMNSKNSAWEGSNFGPLVDLYAPGEEVLSSRANLITARLNGTSYSAPYVSGFAALLTSYDDNEANRGQDLCSRIQGMALRDVLTNVPAGTKNLLLHANVPELAHRKGARSG